jgi:NTP pyrophosphatase (non-canonical NTP hydrolase)
MTTDDYIKAATALERTTYEQLPISTRMLHGIVGIATEAGELLDAAKKRMFYGAPLDAVNLVEEIGDVLWYMAILCDELDVTFEMVMETNINKLHKRYKKGKFSKSAAMNRNLPAEREVLEQSAQ